MFTTRLIIREINEHFEKFIIHLVRRVRSDEDGFTDNVSLMFRHDDGNTVGGRRFVGRRWSHGVLLGVLEPHQDPGQAGDVRAGPGAGAGDHADTHVVSPGPTPV